MRSELRRLSEPYNIVRPSVQKCTPASVLLDTLTLTEKQFVERGMLPGAGGFPLWFTAENERNVFLWRNGLSLGDKDRFQFWVDIPKLIEKREIQLRNAAENDPFTNTWWGMSAFDRTSAEEELAYLDALSSLLADLCPHLHALSQASIRVMREMGHEFSERPVVVLPFARVKTSVRAA